MLHSENHNHNPKIKETRQFFPSPVQFDFWGNVSIPYHPRFLIWEIGRTTLFGFLLLLLWINSSNKSSADTSTAMADTPIHRPRTLRPWYFCKVFKRSPSGNDIVSGALFSFQGPQMTKYLEIDSLHESAAYNLAHFQS